MRTRSTIVVKQTEGSCPVCQEDVFFAAGRGYCPECSITFPMPHVSRKDLMSAFAQKFYISKLSGYYHREGCKYLKNISEENLVVISEPLGKPCRCAR